MHVLSGMLALLIGPFQFVRRLRRRFVRVHRFMGATYVASATALGVSGLILAPTAYTGLVASAGFTVLGLAMLFTTWTAGADDPGRPVWRAPALDDPQLLPDHGRSHAASVATATQRSRRGRDRRFLVRDGVRRDRLAVLVPNLLLAIWFTRCPIEVRMRREPLVEAPRSCCPHR